MSISGVSVAGSTPNFRSKKGFSIDELPSELSHRINNKCVFIKIQ